MHRFRTDMVDPSSATEAHMYKAFCVMPLLFLKCRVKAVHDLLVCIGRDGFTLSRGLELRTQWDGMI